MSSSTSQLSKKYQESPDGKLCANLDKSFLRCAEIRSQFERQWYLNIAFYFGRQWVGWTGIQSANKFELRDFPIRNKWEVRVVANKIKSAIRKEHSKLIKEEPQYFVNPSTSENEDIAAARAANLIAEYLLDTGGYNAARRLATWWMVMCGTGYLTAYPKGTEKSDYGLIIPDTIAVKNVPTFNIYVPNLQEPDIENQPRVYHAYTADPEALYAHYQVEIPSEELPAGADFQNRLMQMMGVKNEAASTQGRSVLVKEIYEKPSVRFPKGAMLVTAAGKLLYMVEELKESPTGELVRAKEVTPEEVTYHQATDNSLGYKSAKFPFKHGMYPFAKMDHIFSGRYYGVSTIEDMIPLQKEYNRARSQIRMGANLTSSPQWKYQEGSIVNPRKLTNRPGELIAYRAGFGQGPEPVKQPDYPSYAIQDQDRILKDMDDATQQYEVSHGQAPPGVEAASAIAYLQEENDSVLHPTSASIEEATQKIGIQCLSLVQEFWSKEKIIKVTSRNNVDDVEAFHVADMKDNTDFRVEPGSMVPRSRAAKQALIMELMKGGYIEPQQGLQYLQMVETNRLWEDMQLDSRQVQRENMMFKKAEPVKIHSYDNHALHVLYHERWMKTQDFELLDPTIQQTVENHVQQHKLEIVRVQQQATQGAQQENVGNGTEPGNAAGSPDGQQPSVPV